MFDVESPTSAGLRAVPFTDVLRADPHPPRGCGGRPGDYTVSVRPRRTRRPRVMTRVIDRTVLCSLTALVGLWSCLTAEPLFAAPFHVQASVNTEKIPLAINIDDLFQHWLRSTEEERPGETVQVFRPAGSITFPPSRFRMEYKFNRNGVCEWYSLASDDAHRFKTGTWRIDANDSTMLQITADGTVTLYRIVTLSRTLLRLAPVEPASHK